MYVANHHVKLKGKRYIPGEVLPDDVPAETAAWWLSVGAIREVGEPAAAGSDAPERDYAPENTPDLDEPVTEDEAGDVEPEEIDAMAGIVTDEPEPEPKTAKRTTRRTGGKKS